MIDIGLVAAVALLVALWAITGGLDVGGSE